MTKLLETRAATGELLADLSAACRDRTVITLVYTDAGGDLTVRPVEPDTIDISAKGDMLLRAHCRLRGERRSFRIDRIDHYVLHHGVPYEVDRADLKMDAPVIDRVTERQGRALVPAGSRVMVEWSDTREREIVAADTLVSAPSHLDVAPSSYWDRPKPEPVKATLTGTVAEVLRCVADWARGVAKDKRVRAHRFSLVTGRALCDSRISPAPGGLRSIEDVSRILPTCARCERAGND